MAGDCLRRRVHRAFLVVTRLLAAAVRVVVLEDDLVCVWRQSLPFAIS
jgi:hypothetical protein